jgi:DNA-binding beta-propeller fold protein YncE
MGVDRAVRCRAEPSRCALAGRLRRCSRLSNGAVAGAVQQPLRVSGSGRDDSAGFQESFSTGLPSDCLAGFAGNLRAEVGPFRPIDSGVPDASGSLVADLQPGPMALGPNGVLYISEPSLNQVVARMPNGSFKLVAGTGSAGYSGDGASAVHAMLNQPEGLAVAPDGTLYIADFQNNRVREVLPNPDHSRVLVT